MLRVHLIEALRADAEAFAAQLVLHVPFAIEGDFLRAQHHAGFALIAVQHHGRDFRVALNQLLHKCLFSRKFKARRDQHDHNLPRHMPRADEDMAQKAAVRVLVVDAQLVGRQHRDDGLDDAVGAAILNQAVPHGHDAVRPHGVHAADGLARLVH